MALIEWSKKQERTFSGNKFGVSEKEYNVHPKHYLKQIERDTSIAKNKAIICLGCNDGTHVKEFYDAGYDAFGVDLPKVIEKAHSKHSEIADRLICCNLEKELIPSTRTWNLIFAKSVIEHLVNWYLLPKKMYDAQSINGMIWVSTKNGDIISKVERDHFVHIGFEELENIFKKVGYSIVKHYEDPLSKEGQILVAKKE